MPTFSLAHIAKYIFTISIVFLLTFAIVSYVASFVSILGALISKISGLGSSIDGLDIGWFANTIGLVSFMNSVMVSLYVAGSFFISSLVTLLGLKFVIKFYTGFTKV